MAAEEKSEKVKTWKIVDTTLTADCVEFCPAKSFSNLLVSACYQLREGQNKREGRIYLHSITEEKKEEDGVKENEIDLPQQPTATTEPTTLEMKTIQQIDMAGVFDCKWRHDGVSDVGQLLGVVDSAGSLSVLKLEEKEKGEEEIGENYQLEKVCSGQLEGEEEVMALSLDWDSRLHPSKTPNVVSSYSDGGLAVWQVGNEQSANNMRQTHRWSGHQFESWIAAFDYFDTNIIYSGGDDCYFRIWDLRMIDNDPDQPVNSIRAKRYSMGVTSIQSYLYQENIVVVGSYDETVSFFDNRMIRSPICSLGVGGGVWRLKSHHLHPDLLLVAAMHSGFHILQVNPSEGKMENLLSYNGHSSLAYGVDWSYQNTSHSSPLVSSSSFYDHSHHLWQPVNLFEEKKE